MDVQVHNDRRLEKNAVLAPFADVPGLGGAPPQRITAAFLLRQVDVGSTRSRWRREIKAP